MNEFGCYEAKIEESEKHNIQIHLLTKFLRNPT